MTKRPPRAPEAPSHLSPAAAAWWADVCAEFVLESHHAKLLTLAAEAHDRCTAAREAIQTHGLTFADRFGQPHARPEVAIERDSRLAFARLVRELGLDLEAPAESRPNRIGGRR